MLCFILGCENRSTNTVPTTPNVATSSGSILLQTIVHDDCEYVVSTIPSGHGSRISTVHKQNCKYCLERNKK